MSDTYGLPEMVAELMRDEGTLLYVYDDATGLPIVAGTLVKGNPTIGTGRNLAKGSTQISMAENFLLLGNDITRAEMILDRDPDWSSSSWDWRTHLSPIRQRAIINLLFNMGEHTLDEFTHFRDDLQAGEYAEAGAELEESNWWFEVKQRAQRIQFMIIHDAAPPDEPAPAALP
jgi:lysozyme